MTEVVSRNLPTSEGNTLSQQVYAITRLAKGEPAIDVESGIYNLEGVDTEGTSNCRE
ncbi:MAG: hypothetical protein IH919_07195 [Deltaproteobacteria bacterium]|nr:hypothetical protein [Deltaproteobacteria bacterium]